MVILAGEGAVESFVEGFAVLFVSLDSGQDHLRVGRGFEEDRGGFGGGVHTREREREGARRENKEKRWIIDQTHMHMLNGFFLSFMTKGSVNILNRRIRA